MSLNRRWMGSSSYGIHQILYLEFKSFSETVTTNGEYYLLVHNINHKCGAHLSNVSVETAKYVSHCHREANVEAYRFQEKINTQIYKQLSAGQNKRIKREKKKKRRNP